jgi:cell division protein FtsA
MRRKAGSTITGLDIGSAKVCCAIADQLEGGVEIIGLGTHPSTGLVKGMVVDVEATTEAIGKAVEEAEKMAHQRVRSAFIGIAGTGIKGFASQGMLPLRGRKVTAEDMERVIEAAAAVAIPKDLEVLHVLPQEYILDYLGGVKDPIGMQGARLEANCYIVTMDSAAIAPYVQCCREAGIDIDGVVLETLAAADAALADEERQTGAALLDIGGGTTGMMVFHNEAVKHVAAFAYGGGHVTNDIARCLHLTTAKAEWLKKRYGHCLPADVMPGEEIEVESVGDGETVVIDNRVLCEIIEARVDEILQLALTELQRVDLDRLVKDIVLTGGSAHLRGIDELASKIFNRHVRIGQPRHIGGLVDVVSSPMYAAAVGLVLFGSNEMSLSKYGKPNDPLFGRVSRKFKTWVTKLIK